MLIWQERGRADTASPLQTSAQPSDSEVTAHTLLRPAAKGVTSDQGVGLFNVWGFFRFKISIQLPDTCIAGCLTQPYGKKSQTQKTLLRLCHVFNIT